MNITNIDQLFSHNADDGEMQSRWKDIRKRDRACDTQKLQSRKNKFISHSGLSLHHSHVLNSKDTEISSPTSNSWFSNLVMIDLRKVN